MQITTSSILEALSNVIEPDLKKSITELDLVQDIQIDGTKISFKVKVSNPALHSRKRVEEACKFQLERALGKEIVVDITTEGLPKDPEKKEQRKTLPGVKNIIAVASGKGGVGKSTITTNLAAGLAKQGYRVGLVDADIYGPSAPTMFDVVGQRPQTIEVDGVKKINPIMAYGVKILSIGFFTEVDKAVIWRGPMASKALKQIINDAHWGELDYLLIDLPPGTSDIHLSMVQNVPVSGAIIVSTPQEVALVDARRGVDMFRQDEINVPILGFVENMAWFTPEELPENKYYIFGRDGVKNLAEGMDIPLLGQIPLVQSLRESGDCGRPAVLQDRTSLSMAFDELVDELVTRVEWRNQNMDRTRMVEMKS
jgi:ATP-binding protein involved in chromosome partitioning